MRTCTCYIHGQPKEGRPRKSFKNDKREAKWYIPLVVHEGITVHPLDESVCPHFSTIHDALEALILFGMIPLETCQRCGYEWVRRTDNTGQCPSCGSSKWKTPREEGELGRKPNKTGDKNDNT